MLRLLLAWPRITAFQAGTHNHHYHVPLVSSTLTLTVTRGLSTSVARLQRQMPPRPKHPPEDEIEESFLKGSGPGGQKINKTNSAVQLKHIPTGIVIKSQATRSRSQNRKIARDLLAAKLDELYNGAQSRSAIVSEVKKKRAASAAKKSRRKYRKLAEEKAAAGLETDGEPADTDEEMEAEVLIARDDPRHVPAQAQVANTKNQT